MATVCCQIGAGLIIISGPLIPSTTVAIAVESPISEVEQAGTEQQIAAYHASPTTPSFETPPVIRDREVRERIAEARRVLTELHAFIEETARAVKLDNHLKIRQMENDRLKEMLSNNEAAKRASEIEADPIDDILSALTRTVVRNWLESVQLTYRSVEAERKLISSQRSWSNVKSRVAKLRQSLLAHRTELRALRLESAVLSDEVNRMRRHVTRTNAEAHLLKQQRNDITATTEALRRNVTSKLREALLNSGH